MRKRAQAAAPVLKRDRNGCVIRERCGWTYIGEPGASYVRVDLTSDDPVSTHYAITRARFDSMSDAEFADHMEQMKAEHDV